MFSWDKSPPGLAEAIRQLAGTSWAPTPPSARPPARQWAARASQDTMRYDITQASQRAISRIDRCAEILTTLELPARVTSRLRHTARIEEAHYSVHIEGSRLSLADSQLVLSGGRGARHHLLGLDREDVRELRNAMAVLSHAKDCPPADAPLSEVLIREVHRGLVRGVRHNRAEPGAYRSRQNYVVNSVTQEVIYEPPPPIEVPRLMSELVAWVRAQSAAHPLVVAALAHFQLVDIHPFVDGNGRTARLLPYIILRPTMPIDLVPMSQAYDRDRPAYYRAIQSVRQASSTDATAWLEYILSRLADQLDYDVLPTVVARAPRHLK